MLTESSAADKGEGVGEKSAAVDGSASRKMKKEGKDKGPKVPLEDKRKIAYEWFVDPEQSDINKFCAEVKDAPAARGFVRKAMKQLELAPLRKRRLEDEAIDGQVLEKLMKFRPNKAVKVAVTAEEKFDVKTLLKEWFDDEEMIPLGKFLRKRNQFSLKKDMLLLVSQNRLKKLRRERDDPKARALAMKRIDRASFCEGFKDASTVSDDGSPEMKALLREWFENDEMVPVGKFLRKRNKIELRDDLHSLIRQNRLKKLFKGRDDPKIQSLAMKRIEHASLCKDAQNTPSASGEGASLAESKKIKRKGAACTVPGAVKVCGLAVEAADQDIVRSYLKGWFCDHSRTSISDYLEAKGRLDLLPVVKRIVRKLDLGQLRREHHVICKKANKKIDGVFKMKKGKTKNDNVALKEEDKMPIPSAPPLDEGTLPEDFVDVVAADISKKMDIEEKGQLTPAAPMDTDDDDSGYVSIAETTVVGKNLVDGK